MQQLIKDTIHNTPKLVTVTSNTFLQSIIEFKEMIENSKLANY